ncbi:FUSC family protein [Pseudoxanthobacter sp.]|uniref:FUSC family protein n=1 Tax=Pseudoxanthobacter sp. TaxID=1925742 RepID=UPI002FE08A58
MEPAQAQRRARLFALPVDTGWRNVVFALRTTASALLALAIAYALELREPQWATITVFLLSQATVGAVVAKSVWRTIGTVCGGTTGLILVGLFSQAPALLVAATAVFVGLCFFIAARLRNFASYGAVLGAYTALLISFEGSADPLAAWWIAGDRVSEILIGIACSTAAGALVMPRYAGDALRESLATVFSGLAGYCALALQPSVPPATFVALRGRMVSAVTQFDALRSYTLFEAPEMHADDRSLRRVVREFLTVLSIGRGLFFRLEDFRRDDTAAIRQRMDPVLEATRRMLEAIAADPTVLGNPAAVRRQLAAARADLRAAAADLNALAGTVPFGPLANALLVVSRAGDLLHALSVVMVTEATGLRTGRGPAAPAAAGRGGAGPALARQTLREAGLIGLRAALALVLIAAFWMATGWDMGMAAISGATILLFSTVNQDNPLPKAYTYLVWMNLGIAAAYGTMIVVLPLAADFTALALALMPVLVVAALMAGTPALSAAGFAFGIFFMAQITIGNSVVPDETAFVNSAAAMIVGMIVCMAVLALFPVTSQAARGESWHVVMTRILPAAARGQQPSRAAAREVLALLMALLPRLATGRPGDDDFLRGTLGAASAARELGRLAGLARDPAMPPAVAAALGKGLEAFAAALASLADPGRDVDAALSEARAAVSGLRSAFAGQPLPPQPAARARLLSAAAGLRFIDDRFDIDRPFLERRFSRT